MKLITLIIGSLMLTACSTPSRWAEKMEQDVSCDISVADVQKLIDKDIIVEDVPRKNRTHYIRSGDTDVWLVFVDNKLKSVQVLWAHEMMKYASYQQVQLCES